MILFLSSKGQSYFCRTQTEKYNEHLGVYVLSVPLIVSYLNPNSVADDSITRQLLSNAQSHNFNYNLGNKLNFELIQFFLL